MMFMDSDLDKIALDVTRKMLAVEGRYCQVISPLQPVGPQTMQFMKRDPVTGRVFRVTLREELL